jgi:transcription initiation factor IIE alpha subunit
VLVSGFLFPWSVVFLTWLLRWLALKYVEKKSSNTEEAELVEKIGAALREAKPLLYKVKEGKLVDKEMVINFLKDKKELIEHITEMYNK